MRDVASIARGFWNTWGRVLEPFQTPSARRSEERERAYSLGAQAGCVYDRSRAWGSVMYKCRRDLQRAWERGYDDVQG